MLLRKFLRALDNEDCFTIASEHGEGWIYYHDGVSEMKEIPNYLLEREVKCFYNRDRRRGYYGVTPLNAGLAILVEGYEDGDI